MKKPCRPTLLKGKFMPNLKNGRCEKGLTLVEIVITIAILGVVITAIYSFYLAGIRGWNRAVNQMEYQQSARIAVDRIVEELMIAEMVEIRSNNHRTIYFEIDLNGRTALYRFRLTGNQLALERRDHPHLSYNVIAFGLKDLNFLIDENNRVHITAITGDEHCEYLVTASVLPRNLP